MSMRSRLNVAGALEGGVGFFVQVQDVRLFGEETGTLTDFSGDNIDFHQAYLDLRSDHGIRFRAGRQELALGGERLIGSVGWTQQGRSFDGARFTWTGDRVELDIFGFVLGDATAPSYRR